MEEKEYLTEEHLVELKKEFEDLTTNKRQDIAQRLEFAKSLGDLSENSEYKDAKEEQFFLEAKIAHLERVIRNAVIISKKEKSDTAQLGSVVTVQKQGDGDNVKQEYRLVGSEEANVAEGKISNESPLGIEIIGKKKGGVVEIKAPSGKIKYKIIDIN